MGHRNAQAPVEDEALLIVMLQDEIAHALSGHRPGVEDLQDGLGRLASQDGDLVALRAHLGCQRSTALTRDSNDLTTLQVQSVEIEEPGVGVAVVLKTPRGA